MQRRPVLVIEDDESDVRLIREAFDATGISNPLIFMESGRQALDYLMAKANSLVEDRERTPCLILLDLSLPEMTGMDVLKELRGNRHTRRIPVVVLSVSVIDKDIIEAYKLGASSFVSKATRIDKFNEDMEALCKFWLNVAQLPVA